MVASLAQFIGCKCQHTLLIWLKKIRFWGILLFAKSKELATFHRKSKGIFSWKTQVIKWGKCDDRYK